MTSYGGTDPCPRCCNGEHDRCHGFRIICDCINPHRDDNLVTLDLKEQGRRVFPGAERRIRGGWRRAGNNPIRVSATLGGPST